MPGFHELKRLPATAPFPEAVRHVADYRWLRFVALTDWFRHDTSDAVFAVLDPTRARVVVLAATDTDADHEVLRAELPDPADDMRNARRRTGADRARRRGREAARLPCRRVRRPEGRRPSRLRRGRTGWMPHRQPEVVHRAQGGSGGPAVVNRREGSIAPVEESRSDSVQVPLSWLRYPQ
ncbi:DUF6183 family protein [Streptomyces sp. NPDC058632]|uniref:DUF6183 family protein n=1 Tax=Streptomyces sp. NPDC058632 TaxID=3346567 RepID=UPI0036466893